MRITITARHCEIPDELRARARTLLERLGKIAARPHDGQVIFAADHGEAAVEVRLHTAPGKVYVGKASGDDHRTALDGAVQRVRRQLDKRAVPAR
jgi:ribosomal subunit interface protein